MLNKNFLVVTFILTLSVMFPTKLCFAGFSIRPVHPGETRSQLWNDGIIPYVFTAETSKKAKAKTLEAMEMWRSKTKSVIRFVPRKKETDYIEINVAFYKGCGGESESLGNRGGKTIVRYDLGGCPTKDSFDWLLYIPEHELGHVIGLYHE